MIWQPQPGPQSLAIAAHFVRELMYGGARGGGKSDFLIGDFMQDVEQGSKWSGILFRRSYAELEELIKRAQVVYGAVGAEYKIARTTFVFPSGATLKMRYLEKEQDAAKYQGHQYAWVGWDELTNWFSQSAYNMLKACVRSAEGVHNKRIRCSANPGGVGHHWVKEYFVDPNPVGYELIDGKRMFIPAKLTDNRILIENDPEYEDNLRELGSEELIRAWLEGDWNVITGAFFPEFKTATHVIEPFEIPAHWSRFRSGDWGSSTPFSIGWWAVSDGYETPYGKWIPVGALVRYREWYGCGKKANTGIRLTAEEVARGIKSREAPDERIDYGRLDPSAWRVDSGPSVAERMAAEGVFFGKADNGRANGWDQVRQRLKGDGDSGPMIYFFSTCKGAIRTFPALQHSQTDPEDVDTKGEDHVGDDIRYACMSRPYGRPKPTFSKPVKTVYQMTIDELWDAEASAQSNYVQI